MPIINLELNIENNATPQEICKALRSVDRFAVNDDNSIAMLFSAMSRMKLIDMFPKSLGKHSEFICNVFEEADHDITFAKAIEKYFYREVDDEESTQLFSEVLAHLAASQFGFDVDENALTSYEPNINEMSDELFVQSRFFKISLGAYFAFLEKSANAKGFFSGCLSQLISHHPQLINATIGEALRYAFQPVPDSDLRPAYFIRLRYPEIAEDLLICPFSIYAKTHS